jgi:spermidine synthase
VLLLGLGAGSAARIVRALAPRARILGVELDPDVVRAAREHFDLDTLGIEVVQADARELLVRERRHFDAILDDVFVGRGRAVRKPDWLPEPGLALAARRLAPGGVLVTNTLDDAPDSARTLRRLFPRAPLVSIGVEGYDNRILAIGPPDLSARRLRAAVKASTVLGPSVEKLEFRQPRR